MPPKAKYSREEIIEKAFEIAREKGIDEVTAREVAKALGTSSSPIFTAFKNMEEVQNEVRRLAMNKFEGFISDALNYTPAFKYVGMKMIEFAKREPKLFQLIWMREYNESETFAMFFDGLGNTVKVCIQIIQKDYALSKEEAEMLFRQVWLQTYSICVLAAGNVCQLTPDEVSEILSAQFQGSLMLIKSGKFATVPVKGVRSNGNENRMA